MSQIRKYKTGGLPRTIKRGNDDIDLDKYIRNLEGNFEAWLDSQDMNDKEKAAVREAYIDMLNGYNSGELTYQLGGSSEDSTGRRRNLTKGFDSYGAAQNYFNTILQHLSVYTKPAKNKFDKRKSWNNYLNDLSIDYNLFGLMSQDDQNSYLSNLLNDYISNIKKDDYDDYDESYGQNVLSAFNRSITNPELTAKERMDLNLMGIDLSKFYPTVETESNPEPDVDAQLADITKRELINQKLKAINAYNYWTALEAMSIDPNEFRDFSNIGDYRTVYPDTLKIPEDLDNKRRYNRASYFADYISAGDHLSGNTRPDLFTKDNKAYKSDDGTIYGYLNNDFNSLDDNNQVLARQKAHALDWIDYIETNPTEKANRRIKISKDPQFNGWYVVDETFNDSGKVTIIDPTTGNLQNIPVPYIISTDGIENYKDYYLNYRLGIGNIPSSVSYNKEGGILKALAGNTTFNVYNIDKIIKELRIADEAAKKKAKEEALQEGMSDGKTKEQVLAEDRNLKDGLTGIDKARLAGIGLDLIGGTLSLAGATAPIGGFVGVGGTLANFGADLADDAVSTGESFKNLGIGLGLSAVGLIPGVGGTGKVASAVTKAIKYIPKIMVTAGAMNIVFDDDITTSFHKFLKYGPSGISEGKYDNKDLRNLALAVGAVTGLVRIGANSTRKRIIKHHAKVADGESKYSIKTDKGTINLTEQQYKDLDSSKSVKEATDILRAIKVGDTTPYAEHSALGRGSKWKLGFGNKDVFDKSTLSLTKPGYKYELSGDDLTGFGRVLYGNPNSRWSESARILKDLNKSNKEFRIGLGFKLNNGTTTNLITSLQLIEPSSISLSTKSTRNIPNISNKTGINSDLLSVGNKGVDKNGNPFIIARNSEGKDIKFVDLRSAFYTDNKGNLKPKNIGWLNNLLGRSVGPDNKKWRAERVNKENLKFLLPDAHVGFINKNNNIIYWWKQGGSVPASGGLILKGLSGIAPKYYTDRYKYQSLYGWSTSLPHDRRINTNIEGFLGNAENLNTVYNANLAYISNKDNITNDILGYYDYLGSLSPEDFVNAYNNSAKEIRGFFNLPLYYTDLVDSNGNVIAKATDATRHNELHRLMFKSRNTGEADVTGANLGSDTGLKSITGSTTWHRRMDEYENEFDFNNPDLNRIHTIRTKDGRTFLIYKKANGDIDLLPNNSTEVSSDFRSSIPVSGSFTPNSVKSNPSEINPTETSNKSKAKPWIPALLGLRPKKIGLSRLLGTRGTNRDILTIKLSITPDIIDTYKLWHPIHGALSTMEFYNNQANQLRFNARTPYTPDASLNLARLADANRLALALEEKGFLADDSEIRRTYGEDLKRIEGNIPRHSDTANKNRLSLGQYRRTLGLLDADYKLKQWNAKSNWLAEEEQNAKQDYSDYKNFMQNYYDTKSKLDYESAIQPYKEALRAEIAANRNDPSYDYTLSKAYKDYMDIVRSAGITRMTEMYQNQARFKPWWSIEPFDTGWTYTDYN